MLSTVKSYVLDGITARPVRVEVDVHRGLPGFAIVGLPDAAVYESRERVRAALANSGFEFPLRRVVVNLVPASLRKAGPGLDLAIAVGILLSSGQLTWPAVSRLAFVGELALDGSTRALAGSLPIAEAAREDGATSLVLPERVAVEAALASDIDLIALDSLARLPDLIAGTWEPVRPAPPAADPTQSGPDLADLRGQDHLRRALEVAAAGGHNLLLVGPPGAGKSLAATRLPSILPPLSASEALEVARIASATGRFDPHRPLARPFRAPDHTTSPAALAGGGVPFRPGEATLAHRGILYLDELPEFSRDSIEALRVGLRDGEVVIARAEAKLTLPARFMLIAAASPCPCGRGEADPHCTCEPAAVHHHQGRLNSALADGIDIALVVRQPTKAEIAGPAGESSADVRARVIAARERQELRLGAGRCNAEMTPAELFKSAPEPAASALLAEAHRRENLSHSAFQRVVRVAQTIADLAAAQEIGTDHMAEALQLRRRGR